MLTRALLCAACALAVSATPAHATFPGQNGKIAFTHFDDDSTDDNEITDIYTVSPNGRHLVNLTPDSPKSDDYASWSADGRRIAFWSTRTDPDDNPTGDQEIFVMNANGSGLRQVTKNKVDDGGPAWSPNGDRLVFHRFLDDDSPADLWTVRVNGTGERNLTRSPRISERYGVWSPDGREIVIVRRNLEGTNDTNDIYTIRPDGSHLTALINTRDDEASPDWSPDGKRIVFHAAPFQADPTQPFGNADIYVMPRDGGSPPTQLTTSGGGDGSSSYNPAWSPDGRKIVFNKSELFTIRADGSRQKRVRPGFDGHHPDWQPVPKDARAEDDDD